MYIGERFNGYSHLFGLLLATAGSAALLAKTVPTADRRRKPVQSNQNEPSKRAVQARVKAAVSKRSRRPLGGRAAPLDFVPSNERPSGTARVAAG